MNNKGINHFDAVIYINLDHRKDRKKRLLLELEKAEVDRAKIHRIAAYLDPLNGHRGCGKSHVKALDFAIKNKFNNVLILEDDFVFTQEKKAIEQYVSHFHSFAQNAWDVFLLASNVIDYTPTTHPKIKKVLCAQTAHSYAINRPYLPKLKACFLLALSMMENDVFSIHSADNLHAIDHVWKLLQPEDRWYIGEHTIGKQGESFSDIALDHIKRFNCEHYP